MFRAVVVRPAVVVVRRHRGHSLESHPCNEEGHDRNRMVRSDWQELHRTPNTGHPTHCGCDRVAPTNRRVTGPVRHWKNGARMPDDRNPDTDRVCFRGGVLGDRIGTQRIRGDSGDSSSNGGAVDGIPVAGVGRSDTADGRQRRPHHHGRLPGATGTRAGSRTSRPALRCGDHLRRGARLYLLARFPVPAGGRRSPRGVQRLAGQLATGGRRSVHSSSAHDSRHPTVFRQLQKLTALCQESSALVPRASRHSVEFAVRVSSTLSRPWITRASSTIACASDREPSSVSVSVP